MPTFQFIGRVLPEKPPVSLDGPAINVRNIKNGHDVTMQIAIANSAITIEGEANRYEQSDFSLILRRALHLANSAVDLIAFASGAGFRAILDSFVDPSGESGPILPMERRLQKHCTAYSLDPKQQDSFNSMLNRVATSPHLFLALNDLIKGIYDPDEGPICCARAIETIRRALAPKDADTRDQWVHMHNVLNLTKAYLDPITTISAGPRHGDRTSALDGDLVLVADRSWIVMNRCLEFFRRDSGPLPQSEFPTL